MSTLCHEKKLFIMGCVNWKDNHDLCRNTHQYFYTLDIPEGYSNGGYL